MRQVIFAVVALLVGQYAIAQTTAPVEPAKKDAVQQPAPVTGAAAAKNVGTKDHTVQADEYTKAQEKKKAAMKKKYAAKGVDTTPAADAPVRPGSVMTADERAAHRAKLQSFKTLDECQKYQADYQAKVEARAKEQHKTLRAFSDSACNRYKVAAGKPATK
jgi:hypothetical protein